MNNESGLQQAVLAELAWEPSVTAAHIGVIVSAGVVTLTGHVDTFAQKHAAEAAAGRVKGVKAVAEEIEVRLSFETKRSDDEIAAAAIERLAWDVSIPRDAVKVQVEKGWVTLTGEVDWYFQRNAAEQDLRRLAGVVGISDRITIRSKIEESSMADNIKHALDRAWFIDPKMIAVTAYGGIVRLTGTVHSPHDRQMAASTAWAAPGVTSVENDIAVN